MYLYDYTISVIYFEVLTLDTKTVKTPLVSHGDSQHTFKTLIRLKKKYL